MLQDFAKGLIANVQAEAAQLTLMADELSRQGADTQMSAGEPGPRARSAAYALQQQFVLAWLVVVTDLSVNASIRWS